MPRRLRMASGGFVYHALNRAVGRGKLFAKAAVYAAFVKALTGRPETGAAGNGDGRIWGAAGYGDAAR